MMRKSQRSIIVWLVVFISLLSLSATMSYADVLTLRDGTVLICNVLGERTLNNEKYYEIGIDGSRLLLSASLIMGRQQRPQVETQASEREILVNLVREGKLLPSLRSRLGIAVLREPPRVSSEIKIDDLRGWAYFMNVSRGQVSLGTPLQGGGTVEDGSIVQVMANSRLHLTMSDIIHFYLPEGSQVQFEQNAFDAQVFTYRVSFNVKDRFLILKIDEMPSPRKLKLSTGDVYFFTRGGTVVIVNDSEGKTCICPLDESITVTPGVGSMMGHYRVDPGQMFICNQSDNNPAENTDMVSYRQMLASWDEWQPEELDLDWRIPLPPLKVEDAWPTRPMMLPAKIEVIPELIVPISHLTMGETLQAYRQGLESFHEQTGRYPSEGEGLEALRRNPGIAEWSGPYVEENLNKQDMWGQEFVYALFEDEGGLYPDVRSKGPDEQDDRGLDDDLR